MTCIICTESFNASNHKSICCPFDKCAKTACRTCYQTFLCGDDVTVPKCMFCNTQFTQSQLLKLGLTKTFLHGEFAKHQQDILFAQEQAMLPAAQAAVAHDNLIQSIEQQIKDVNQQIKQLQDLKIDLIRTKMQLKNADPAVDNRQPEFIHPCADSQCNGFVSSAWKCATCDKYTCAHCRELKTERDDHAHVCNPDTVASVALLKNDTKPCPNCKVPVHKTDGCDQMFCTQCKRLWSWNTGKFETHGHNPHYLQWMRENQPQGMPRDPNDVLCGREINAQYLASLHNQMKTIICSFTKDHDVNTLFPLFGSIFSTIETIPHLRHHDLQKFQVDRIAINLPARKAFVSNAITLAKFKQMTRRNHMLVMKNDNILQVLQAVIQATTDITYRFQDKLIQFQQDPRRNKKELHEFTHSIALEFYNLKQYANQELAAIHTDFLSPPSKRFFFTVKDFTLNTYLSPPCQPFNDLRRVAFI